MTGQTFDLTIADIVRAIERMAPEQRRQLQRRLHATGLFAGDDLLTDQQKLAVAPSVAQRAKAAVPPPADAAPPPANAEPARREAVPLPLRVPAPPAAGGKAVVGGPEPVAADAAQTMAPLPGLAPEQPIQIIFDGGSRGNPGEGYGSYQMRWPGAPPQVVRLRFGDGVTNNEAEYDTLLAALDAILKRLEENRADPKTARVDVRGDSMLVIKQVLGEWKCKDPRMEARRNQVRARLSRFGGWTLAHHGRDHSVRALGH